MEKVAELVTAFRRNSGPGYGYQKEAEALVKCILGNMLKTRVPELKEEAKNEQSATKFREKGNALFAMGEDDKAIELYSRSLGYAPSDELRSLARANRSAALFRKRLYAECLADVEAALALGHPEDKACKLRERARKAAYLIHKLDANQHLDDDNDSMREVLGDLHLSSRRCAIGEDELQEKRTSVASSSSSSMPIANARYVEREGEPKLAHGPNAEMPAASAALGIAHSDKFGRHLVATKAFRPGDVVAIEEPFAYIVYRQRFYTHCHNCLLQCHTLGPCPQCPLAMYCSDECRLEHWERAHSTECAINTVLDGMLHNDEDKINQFMKIIRLLVELTKNGTAIQELRRDIVEAEKNPDARSAGFTDDGKMDSSRGRCVLGLATNLDARPYKDISAFACIASLATILLATRSPIFGAIEAIEDIAARDDVIFCTSLMYRACFIMSCNSFSIQREPGSKCGSGLYVVHSLLNHACAPNSLRHFEGVRMISRALVPIAPGEQVFTSYCGGFQFAPRKERRAVLLENYHFCCECAACAHDWPSYGDILGKHLGSVANHADIARKILPYRKRLARDKYDIEAVKCALEVLFAEAKMPCEEMVLAMQYMRAYYLGKLLNMFLLDV